MQCTKLIFLLLLSYATGYSMDEDAFPEPYNAIAQAEQALDNHDFSEAAQHILRARLKFRLYDLCNSFYHHESNAPNALEIREYIDPRYGEISNHITEREALSILRQEAEKTLKEVINNDDKVPFPDEMRYLPVRRYRDIKECYKKQKAYLEEYRAKIEKLSDNL